MFDVNEIIVYDIYYSKQLNPQRELPVLDDDGFLLSEHVAILQVKCQIKLSKFGEISNIFYSTSATNLRRILNFTHRIRNLVQLLITACASTRRFFTLQSLQPTLAQCSLTIHKPKWE